ncbi:hypothetical protein L596_005487 [Steinernema carpocapsae]|uniref:Uncharacterized protein n=1 Tax=Steinernema carpocapsae TaxID=34508 RepID=A0A4V6I8M5_STECR|nr:hypothetical protein L596_005487 [Steinernema carpocapsae]
MILKKKTRNRRSSSFVITTKQQATSLMPSNKAIKNRGVERTTEHTFAVQQKSLRTTNCKCRNLIFARSNPAYLNGEEMMKSSLGQVGGEDSTHAKQCRERGLANITTTLHLKMFPIDQKDKKCRQVQFTADWKQLRGARRLATLRYHARRTYCT